MPYYPMFLDLRNKKCLVIGGGNVACRKARMLLEYEANVEIISPKLCLELRDMSAKGLIEVTLDRYKTGGLKDAFLVIAATDEDVVNRQVAKEATERGILINVVDSPELSNFIVPSYLRRGDLTVAISTGGRSPALARKIRMDMEEAFGEEYDSLASLVSEVRLELKQQGVSIPGNVWEEALNVKKLLELLRSGQKEEAKGTLLEALKEASA